MGDPESVTTTAGLPSPVMVTFHPGDFDLASHMTCSRMHDATRTRWIFRASAAPALFARRYSANGRVPAIFQYSTVSYACAGPHQS